MNYILRLTPLLLLHSLAFAAVPTAPLLGAGGSSSTWVVSANADGTGTGTLASPMTLAQAHDRASPGDRIQLTATGGAYALDRPIAPPVSKLTYEAYPGQQPRIVSCTGDAAGGTVPKVCFFVKNRRDIFIRNLTIDAPDAYIYAFAEDFVRLELSGVTARNASLSRSSFVFQGQSEDLRIANADWSGRTLAGEYGNGNDLIQIGGGVRFIEIAYSTFRQGEHNLLNLKGSYAFIHHNNFDNTEVSDGTTGYRAFSLSAPRGLSGASSYADPGPPYGYHLVEHNRIASGDPGPNFNAATAKFQTADTIIRFNEFRARSPRQLEMIQMQTCCWGEGNAPFRAPVVEDQRIYNNRFPQMAETFSRFRTPTYPENPRTINAGSWIFNNHFGRFRNSNPEFARFSWDIHPDLQRASEISGYRVESNSFQDNADLVTCSLSDTTAMMALTECGSRHSGAIQRNRFGSSGGAGQGRALTVTTGSGSNARQIAVEDARVFYPKLVSPKSGRVIFPGDLITVAGTQARVTSINTSTNTIFVDRPVSWTAQTPLNLSEHPPGYTGLPPTAQSGDPG